MTAAAASMGFNPYNESFFDIVNAVLKPADDVKTFKRNVLDCLQSLFPGVGFTFYSYYEMANSSYRYRLTDMEIANLPGWFCDDKWMRNYCDSCIYNPNYHKQLLNPEKSVFTISDLISFSQYERTSNYKDIVQPSGNYYSMVTFLRSSGELIGQIGLVRPKKAGDFTDNEVGLFEKVSRFVSNRMSEFISRQETKIYRRLFHAMMEREANGMLLMDSQWRVVDQNSKFETICSRIYDDMLNPQTAARMVIRKLSSVNEWNRRELFEFARNKGFEINVDRQDIGGADDEDYIYLVSIKSAETIQESAKSNTNAEFETLTDRQQEIIRLMAKGYSNKEIAEELVISASTVKKHLENIRLQLGVSSKIAILQKTNMIQ